MMLRAPVAARPLALLTLAVAAAHLLLLGQSALREPARPAGLRTLVTRVLNVAPPDRPPQPAAPQAPLPQKRAALRPRPARVSQPAAASATAAVTPAQAPASAPLPVIDTSPAPAPASAASPSPAIALAIPGSVRLRYGVTGLSRGQSWTLTGQLLWRHDGSQYEARLEYASPLLASRSQHSTGRITAEGLEPLRFADKGRGERATHFERDSGMLVFSSNTPQQPLLPGAQDRLSVFLQLAAMLAGDPAKFPPGTGISLQTAGTRDAQPWLFMVEGDESLDLPGGTVAARKLVRHPRHDYDIRIELWLGTAMDYVPVRIRLTQPNGDFVDQQWLSTDRF